MAEKPLHLLQRIADLSAVRNGIWILLGARSSTKALSNEQREHVNGECVTEVMRANVQSDTGGGTSLVSAVKHDLPAVRRNRHADFTQPQRGWFLRQAFGVAEDKVSAVIRRQTVQRRVQP